MNELIKNIMMKLPLEYINSNKDKNMNNINNIELYKVNKNFYNNNQLLFYYDNCVIIDEEAANIIMNINEQVKKIITEQSINCIIGSKKILFVLDDILNLGGLDDNSVFHAELIIKINKNNKLEEIINLLKNFKLDDICTFIINEEINNSNCSNKEFDIFKLNEEKKDDFLSKIHENEELNRKTNLLNLNTMALLEKSNFRGRPKGGSKELDNMNFFTLDNEDLKKLIYLYIDYNEIKKKINVCAIENHYNKSNENYYLLNNNWFKNYLNINNLTKIYDYLISNDVIKKINNYDNLPSDQKIFIIFNSIDKKLLINMNNNKKNNDASLKDYKLFQIKFKNIKTN